MIRLKKDDGSDFPEIKHIPFGEILTEYTDKTKEENEDVLLSSAIEGMFLNSELFSHQRGSSNIGYKKIKKEMLILSTQNLHLGNANVNIKYDHGIVSPAYKVYKIHDCLPQYLAYWVKLDKTKDFFLNATTPGASACRRNVDWNALYLQKIAIPDIEEQQKIIDFLSNIDDVITESEKEVVALEEQKKGVMQKIFSQEVRFKADDGSDYPEWEEKNIGNILSICHGKDYKELNEGEIPVYGTGGIISYVNQSLCDWSCVCIGRKGTIDKPMYLDHPFWSVDTLFFSKPKEGNNPKFQYYLFSNINWKKYNEASGVPSLSASTIEKIKVMIPCLEEQKKIADFLSDFDTAIDLAKQELKQWKELKKGLLQQLFE